MEVLIVEDEILLAMDIEAMVEDAGHHVAAGATSLLEVLELSSSIPLQLAFVDLHLADGFSGIDVCCKIAERWPNALIVFMTANVSRIPDDFSCAHGVIAKPFSLSGVNAALRYFAEGIFDPPPSQKQPANFSASPRLNEMWAA